MTSQNLNNQAKTAFSEVFLNRYAAGIILRYPVLRCDGVCIHREFQPLLKMRSQILAEIIVVTSAKNNYKPCVTSMSQRFCPGHGSCPM